MKITGVFRPGREGAYNTSTIYSRRLSQVQQYDTGRTGRLGGETAFFNVKFCGDFVILSIKNHVNYVRLCFVSLI